jgi:hypothetical protein
VLNKALKTGDSTVIYAAFHKAITLKPSTQNGAHRKLIDFGLENQMPGPIGDRAET